jgi:disulfide bond formation protein DsbB
MHFPFSPRLSFLFGFLATVGLMATAFYFQFQEGLEPCPLCISQRLGVVLVGLVMLVGAIHATAPSRVRIYAVLGGLAASFGAAISIRHLYIQHLPEDELPACGPGLSYMFQYFPLGDTLKAMVTGTGDCAHVDWTFLGFSMPFWVLLAFLGLGLWSAAQWWNASAPSRNH